MKISTHRHLYSAALALVSALAVLGRKASLHGSFNSFHFPFLKARLQAKSTYLARFIFSLSASETAYIPGIFRT